MRSCFLCSAFLLSSRIKEVSKQQTRKEIHDLTKGTQFFFLALWFAHKKRFDGTYFQNILRHVHPLDHALFQSISSYDA